MNIEPLIDEVNKEIKERTKEVQLISEVTNDGERGYPLFCDEMDRELKKALDFELSKYKNTKKVRRKSKAA